MAKNPLANAGDTRDEGSIPGSGRSPGEGYGNPASILDWEIPWTKDPMDRCTIVHGVTKELDMT